MKIIDLYYKMPLFIRYPIFLATGVYQAQNRYGRDFERLSAYLMSNLLLSRDNIHDLQMKSMKKLLRSAYTHVPYYKRIFDSVGFEPGDFRDLNDLRLLPILTKEIIKNNIGELISDKIHSKAKALHQTGGTTGSPTFFYLPKVLKGPFNFATLYRFYSWGGVKFGEPRVSIAGRLITKTPPYAMRNIAENQLYVCAHYLQKENLDELIKSIKNFMPAFVQGHPSALAILAHYMLEKGIVLPVKSVFTTSENLYDDQRSLIEMAFVCKVFDTYGMGEMVTMASECTEHKGYHLAPEYGITEVINENSYENGVGELICTSLQNYAMPLIRYKCGDIGKLSDEKCSCGCAFPMLESISGRVDDVLKTIDGRTVLPLSIRLQMKAVDLSDFQVIQVRDNSFQVNLFGFYNEDQKDKVTVKINSVLMPILGNSANILVQFEQIPILTKNGKRQVVIKLV